MTQLALPIAPTGECDLGLYLTGEIDRPAYLPPAVPLGSTREVVRACGGGRWERRMFTYTLPEEGGASLRAAGWSSRPGRRDVVLPEKTRWSCVNLAASQVETVWPWPELDSPQLALWESA